MIRPETSYVIVTVVTPETDDPATSGRVVNFPCSPTVSHELLEQSGDGWTLRGRPREMGYALMHELYRQERNQAGLDKWLAHVAAFQAGKKVKPFPKEDLPREVIRRQACGELDEAQALQDAKRTAPVSARVSKAGL